MQQSRCGSPPRPADIGAMYGRQRSEAIHPCRRAGQHHPRRRGAGLHPVRRQPRPAPAGAELRHAAFAASAHGRLPDRERQGAAALRRRHADRAGAADTEGGGAERPRIRHRLGGLHQQRGHPLAAGADRAYGPALPRRADPLSGRQLRGRGDVDPEKEGGCGLSVRRHQAALPPDAAGGGRAAAGTAPRP